MRASLLLACVVRACIALACIAATLSAAVPARAGAFLRGADVSALPAVEAGGGGFQDEGAPADALTILRARGIDTIRIRLWHTPAGGASGLAQALALAERATAAGCGILLDLHYSDTWADPGHQTVPAAWAGLTLPALADSVRACTRDVLEAFAAHGVVPRVVQIGNEITVGMLWDTGRVGGAWDTSAQWDQLATLIRAGIGGVDDALPGEQRPEVMIHIDRGGDNAGARWFLDHLAARNVAFDLIGLSFYPWWHGTLEALDANIDDLAARYGKGVVVIETAYPWTLGWFDDTNNLVGLPGQLLPGYPATPAGQRDFLAAMMEIVRAVPGGRGRGVFWWAPEWIASPGFGSPWENLALFDEQGQPLPALTAFGSAAAAAKPPLRTGLRLFPNPVARETTVFCAIPPPAGTRLEVFDLRGRRVRREPVPSDAVAWNWRPGSLAAGVYVMRLTAPGVDWRENITVVR